MIAKTHLWDYIAIALMGLMVLVALALLGGCAPFPAREPPLEQTLLPAMAVAPPTDGAIYSSGSGLSLFEDQKARNVGDTLTIILAESTAAKSTAATSTSKDTSSDISAPTVFGQGVTFHGKNIMQGSLAAKHDFSGSGDSTQSNTLQGNVTVTVVARLPNGNLIVRGDKRLQLNQSDETVRIEGVVRPADIAPDNTIASSRVASARIAYSGSGALAESNAKGWLARFFASPLMPF